MQQSDELRLSAPSFTKGGGAITGLQGHLGNIGPDGALSLSLPLPISAGRGFAPALTLNYSSHGGNGSFGIGWNLNLPCIRRRTHLGVPTYQESDEFLGPDGEVLVPIQPDESVTRDTLLGIHLGISFKVTTFRSRIERDFNRLEYWQPVDQKMGDFWVSYTLKGLVSLFGYTPQARISNPNNQTAMWLLESSVTQQGEHCYYQYKEENSDHCNEAELKTHPQTTTQRYLTAVHYGNLVSSLILPCLGNNDPSAAGWLFCLILDYGERDVTVEGVPAFHPTKKWLCRQDCFSGYEYGFEVRTRRLCRQALMFHRLETLAGKKQGEDTPTLVSRLLLKYAENPSISTLISAQVMGVENNKASWTTLPPLTFNWQTFDVSKNVTWQACEELGYLNVDQPYQLIDLYGEGIAGVLHQDNKAWWYRAPQRKIGDNLNEVTWPKTVCLPHIPSLQKGGRLIDLQGNGRLQWLVTFNGGGGYYDLNMEREACHFTPLHTLPVEYTHPKAQLADLIGDGFTDLVMIGPRSVRLYGGDRGGWKKGKTVNQSDGIMLPVPDADPGVLVAFSDLLGSGQQHLVKIQPNGVTCWPNLGHGRFGQPIVLPGFSQPMTTFNPQQVYLADIDGSGTTDLIYAHADFLEIFLNQSGNHFASPFKVTLPEQIKYNRTCRLQVADVQGLGVASLVLSVLHPVPRHWICHLSPYKPWLLHSMNNNMGANHRFHYRSSAQFWLDEKAKSKDIQPPCYLPVVLHTLHRREVWDEITGNRLVSEMRYRHGVWDSQEREFRGFGYVEVQDTDTKSSQGTAEEISLPALTRNWFATGLPVVDNLLSKEYWRGDAQAFTDFQYRFTTGSGDQETIYPLPGDTADKTDMSNTTIFGLQRALQGMPLRSELFGIDEKGQCGNVPYSVTESRPQVRLIDARSGKMPVVWPSVAESRSLLYEQVDVDPRCSQQTVLASNQYGQPLRQATIYYSRRKKPKDNPYPKNLPETLFDSSYDAQQQILYLQRQQHDWHPEITDTVTGIRVTGLTNSTRTDVFSHTADTVTVPPEGLTLEELNKHDTQFFEESARTFAGQQQVWYQDKWGQPTTVAPTVQALVAFTETAELDATLVASLSEQISEKYLKQAGYQQTPFLFSNSQDKLVWVMRHGYTEYADQAGFWRPLTQQETKLTGKNTINWDTHYCVITQFQDAAGLLTRATYDYRFLTPKKITDANDNVSQIALDGLGRVIWSRFWGTENNVVGGYSQATFTAPDTVDSALELTTPLPVASCTVYVTDSWTQNEVAHIPPHTLMLMTDSYDSDPDQQIRQQVTFSDGFGRLLQSATRQAPGIAWRYDGHGGLKFDGNGKPTVAKTETRWAVTGRTEYDNKGQPIRTYQPYFLDNWRYVSDYHARTDLYADTHYYDPIGRVYQVKTAKGSLRRTFFTPWFVANEDENDTALESGVEL
ncbi:SpvB/TcaC N-terminal domain-containing protein [Xenorhabdus indica]|uniref:SpvB/TcaC N-terminal domain-containing protein n=1 Tax=Xenorhabdus indica TaxID=333964 RepID=UPI001656918A|nr:SpvB/TcaC N-terminal domain-containing protein [Xenorhabdus indica]MBC8947241.1 hypothetical protein [Xenorhabdus indica]